MTCLGTIFSLFRMIEFPELRTNGELVLDRRTREVSLLHELISLRNHLVHVRNDAIFLESTDSRISLEGNTLTVVVDEVPTTPWLSVTLEKAQAIREALEIYYHEVLFPSDREIRPGRIVTE